MIAKFRDIAVILMALAGIVAPLLLLFAALGSRFGIISWKVGLLQLTPAAVGLALLTVALAIAVLILSVVIDPAKGRALAAILLVPSVGIVAWFAMSLSAATSVPPINDVSTDRTDPPAFSNAIEAARTSAGAESGLDYFAKTVPMDKRFGEAQGRLMHELQAAGYPELEGITLAGDPEAVLARARNLAADKGWTIISQDTESGTLEASTTSLWFGFTDDIIIRVRPADGGGSRVDMRSTSRVGVSDLGANAKRIRAFFDQLKAQ